MIDVVTYKTGPARFTMVGTSLPKHVLDSENDIPIGLAKRIYKYAKARFEEAGFPTKGRKVEVYSIDGDEELEDRSYCVKFQNAKGGYLELVGILINNGIPTIDHGFEVGVD